VLESLIRKLCGWNIKICTLKVNVEREIMNSEDLGNLVSINTVREKAQKIKGMYNPNLINHLSKEAFDLYLIRESICNQILEITNEKDNKYGKIIDFVKKKIKENKNQLKQTSDEIELTLIQQIIEEWEEFL